jgi:hypothetical protein
MEELALQTNNEFNMTRRGYVYLRCVTVEEVMSMRMILPKMLRPTPVRGRDARCRCSERPPNEVLRHFEFDPQATTLRIHDEKSGLANYTPNVPETSLESILQAPHGIDMIHGNALIKQACSEQISAKVVRVRAYYNGGTKCIGQSTGGANRSCIVAADLPVCFSGDQYHGARAAVRVGQCADHGHGAA